jgi:ribosomal protein S27AE
MKLQTKQQRLAESLFAEYGIPIEVTMAGFAQEPESDEDKAIEAEAVLIYYQVKGKGFTKQECPECGEIFAYKYRTALGPGLKCSNVCRQKALEKLGIKWDPSKPPEQRWGMQDQTKGSFPVIIGGAALKTVDCALENS